MIDADALESRRLPTRIAACRLDALESQQVFRSLLDCISRPGSIAHISDSIWRRLPSVLAPALVLADVETTIHIVETETFVWSEAASLATGARPSIVSSADLICVPSDGLSRLESILRDVRRGTAFEPEMGARLSLGVHDLRDGGTGTRAGVQLVLRGPGIDGDRSICVDGLTVDHIEAWRRVNTAFPAGIDVWMTTHDGRVVGIPRSTRIELSATWPDEERS